jgi:RNA polymerase sigma factor (sigma-70 family)
VSTFSRVILHAVRAVHREHDAVMDAYTFVLDKLREDDVRRLRTFAADGTGKFTTWLVVVARRLAYDHHRHRYGRKHGADDTDAARAERAARRRLVDLASDAIDLARLPNRDDASADARVSGDEIRAAVSQEIDALGASDRLLLKLRFEDGLSAKEIADVTDSATPFHVYRRINAVLAALRRRLVARGVENAVP